MAESLFALVSLIAGWRYLFAGAHGRCQYFPCFHPCCLSLLRFGCGAAWRAGPLGEWFVLAPIGQAPDWLQASSTTNPFPPGACQPGSSSPKIFDSQFADDDGMRPPAFSPTRREMAPAASRSLGRWRGGERSVTALRCCLGPDAFFDFKMHTA